MPSQSVRHLVKTLGAASLVGISSVVGSPIAGAMVMTVGGSIVDALVANGVNYVAANHSFRQSQVINHDLQGALQRAFEIAIKRLEKQWWNGTGKTLSGDEREPVKTFFELLRKDAGAAFSDDETSDLLQSAAGIQSSGDTLQQVVEAQLRSYLHGHDERLVIFMSSKLLDEIALCFSEELKTDDRAWRAYQRLVNEGLKNALNQMIERQEHLARQHADQIDRVLDALRDRGARLDCSPPEQRDPWGQDALDRVHDRLAAKIAEEAERTRETVRDEHDRTRSTVLDGQAAIHAKLDEGFTLLLTQLQKQATSFTAGELLRSAARADIQVWRVPRSRNPHFIGREALLDRLVSDAADLRRTPVIHPILGLGGIGKSQLAAEVAYRRADDCKVVWWVRAQDATTLVSDLAELAIALELPAARAGKPDEAAAAARAWLESSDDAWLLIFDNAEHPETLEPYLPTKGNGQILVTSRIQGWRHLATPIDLSLLSPEAATTFLLKRTGQDDADGAAALANELGRLPLALEHAAAFIDETRYPTAQYLELVRANAGRLLGARDDVTDVGAAVTTVWHASISAVARTSPGAHALLNLGAFLAPELIPLDLIGAHTDQMPEALTAVFRDPPVTTEAVSMLYRYSLVDVSDDRSISVHRLAQLAVRESLSPEDRRRWASIAVKTVRSAFPFDASRPATWPPSDRLLPHVLAACGHAEVEGAELATASALLDRAARHLQTRGKFATAKALLERALASGLATYGPDHPYVATYRNNLGLVLQDLGDLAGAKALFEQALASGLATHGPDHPTVATRRNNLGLVLQDLGDLAGAKTLFEQALEGDLVTYGPDHPTVAIRRGNLGRVLQELGDLAGAEQEQKQALTISIKTYGPDHPTVAIRRGNLGGVLKELGDLDGAKQLFEQALASGLKIYGLDHPTVASYRSNLGIVLRKLGDLAGAEQEQKQALASDLKTFGPDHPTVAIRRGNLGVVLRELGDLDGAKQLFEQALGSDLKRFGPDHPTVAKKRFNLGVILNDLGERARARSELEQALSTYRQHGREKDSVKVEERLRGMDQDNR